MANNINCNDQEDLLSQFITENKKEGVRVFVAGGSRGGNDIKYARETYNLGKKIVEMGFKLDFGLSNTGIMGAVARGVMDAWNAKNSCNPSDFLIQGITTQEYFKLYDSEDSLLKHVNVIFAKTLEERKQKLLAADFVVFAPGGVGTLDELAYDCVAMQDGLLKKKPFVLYNIDGFFHYLLEFLKSMSHLGFSDPVPFIVADNDFELEIALSLLKLKYSNSNKDDIYTNSRKLVYELPYFIKRKLETNRDVIDILLEMRGIRGFGSKEDKLILENDIETAYLEKETERMYNRLSRIEKDVSTVNYKLAKLKRRKEKL